MNKKKGIYILGDVHGDWVRLNQFINRKLPKVVILAGDVGYFWKHDFYDSVGKIKTNGTKVYWIPGNHENMDWCKSAKFPPGPKGIYEIEKDIFMCAFGSMKKFGGQQFLFCGGADSIDKHHRTVGKSWWRNETIQNYEFDALPDPKKVKIDVVVSHTKPNYFHLNHVDNYKIDKYNDPSCAALDQVFDMYKPSKWFFGHFHHAGHDKYQECEWIALDCLGDSYGWRKLDELWLNEDEEIAETAYRLRMHDEYVKELDRRENPDYEWLSEWPDNLGKCPGFKTKEEQDKEMDF